MAADTLATWWDLVCWVADTALHSCVPVIPPLFSSEGTTTTTTTVVGTILCPLDSIKDNKLRLCFQKPLSPDPFLLLMDLPRCDLEGVCRLTLECSAEHSGDCPLLDAPGWVVRCNGQKVGFGRRRTPTEADMWALDAVRVVSTGVGVLLPPPKLDPGSSVGAFMYMRGSFERVVGSRDTESYHLVDPTGCLGPEMSFFFFRI